MEETFSFILEVIGTVACAISGIRLAATKNFDWFGAYTVGLVTAIGEEPCATYFSTFLSSGCRHGGISE